MLIYNSLKVKFSMVYRTYAIETQKKESLFICWKKNGLEITVVCVCRIE